MSRTSRFMVHHTSTTASFIQAAGYWASAKQDGVVPEDCQGSDGRHGVGTEDAASRDIAIG